MGLHGRYRAAADSSVPRTRACGTPRYRRGPEESATARYLRRRAPMEARKKARARSAAPCPRGSARSRWTVPTAIPTRYGPGLPVASRVGSPTHIAERAAILAIPTGPDRAHLLPRTTEPMVPTNRSAPLRPSPTAPSARGRAQRDVRPSSPLRRRGTGAVPDKFVEGIRAVRNSLRRAMVRNRGCTRWGRRAPGSPRVRFAPAGRRAGPAGGFPPQAAHRLRRDARSRLAPPDGHDRRWLGSPAVRGGTPLIWGAPPSRARGFASQPRGWFARSAIGEARKDTGKSHWGKSGPSE
jgi:hypothetical protein